MTQTPSRSDAGLKTAVVDELGWTPSVDGTHIGVAVDSGWPGLRVRVPELGRRRQVEDACWSAPGVAVVENALTIGPVADHP